ncbi:YeiH family protein [Litorisediminicola beolgyonensis]|uniref:YeiH family protein n=1 Tax=Litorisediminicola beolgyonensis TaxID=1173614 RepID=A0ABW3ZL96_9RHOB
MTDTLDTLRRLFPGLLVALLVALASRFVSEHYGAPAMLLALLFGIALNFLAAEPKVGPGIAFASRTLLRFGVALLGLRITLELVTGLGAMVVGLIVAGVVLTILFGLSVSRFFGFRYRFAFLSAGSVAICGASAALAIAAILPRDEKSEDRLVFTVVGVTVLSTVAMIIYPILTDLMGLNDREAGIFIGATVHDVAQVVGAGYSISVEAGDTATLVKLLRVVMLAPVVALAALVVRSYASEAEMGGTRPPIVPVFVMGFLALAVLSASGLAPEAVTKAGSNLSSWCLLTAIAAVGVKTQPGEVLKVGSGAALLIVTETLFLAALVAIALAYMPSTT